MMCEDWENKYHELQKDYEKVLYEKEIISSLCRGFKERLTEIDEILLELYEVSSIEELLTCKSKVLRNLGKHLSGEQDGG